MVARKPKHHTLTRSEQFRTCYSNGKKVVCRHAVVFYHDVKDAGGVQCGVVASRKVGNAVHRNRAKRLLREAARQLTQRMNDRDIWIVLIARSTIITKTSGDVTSDLEDGFTRAGLLE